MALEPHGVERVDARLDQEPVIARGDPVEGDLEPAGVVGETREDVRDTPQRGAYALHQLLERVQDADGVVLPGLRAAGLPPRARVLHGLVDAGRKIAALGVSEPGTGSDVGAITTRAVRDGDEYVVNGAKTFITSGTRADFVTTAVRTGGPGHRGVSLMVIETNRPGFTVTSRLKKMGWLCSDTAELSFDDVRVPARNLVGDEGTAFVQLMQRFESERLLMAAQAVATAERCLALARQWAHDRVTFGEPLSHRQVIRHRLADMAREVAVSRTYVRDVVVRWSAGRSTPEEVAIAKNAATTACDTVVDAAVQIQGGMGYMRESEVERHYRDARILSIGGGTFEMMNEIIAKRVVDRACRSAETPGRRWRR